MYCEPKAATASTPTPSRKGRQGTYPMPLCTVDPEASQKLSVTGLRDEETGLEGSELAWNCPQVV